MTVEWKEGQNGASVLGGGCPHGVSYAVEEILHPKRMLTTTVAVSNGVFPVVPVRTEKPIPKELLQNALMQLKCVSLKAPVEPGTVILRDIMGTGVAVLATAGVEAVQDGI